MTQDDKDSARMRYLAKRATVSRQLGKREVFSIADAWPLYAGRQNLMRYLFIGHILWRTNMVPGHLAEFGCWRGATTSFMAKLLSPTSSKRVHGFDSFKGFDKRLVKAKGLRSGYKGNQDELETLLDLDGLGEVVELHVGDICDAVPALAEHRPELRWSFCYIDCDVYEPCKAALDYIHPRLSPGGIIAFDEFGDLAWPGETLAAEEFLQQYGHHYTQEATPVPQPSLVLVKK